METAKVTISAGPHDRHFVPIRTRIPVPQDARSAVVEPYMANPPKKGFIPAPSVAAQIGERGSDGTAEVTFILPYLARNAAATFQITFLPSPADEKAILAPQNNGDVEVTISGTRLGRYHADEKWARPFLHPVVGPFGHSVTRGWPVEPRENESQDHHHHKSLWVAHGSVNGVDNWSEETGHGRQIQKQVLNCGSGPVFGVLETVNDWVDNSGKKVCEDRRKWCFWAMPQGLRMFDLEVEFRATEGPVVFGDTKEGGIIAVRVATCMDVPRTGRITNADGGTNEPETWGKRSPWCDYSGLDEGGNEVGVALFNHPKSFRYPTYWHVRNYGLMTANPFGLSEFYGDKSRNGSHTLGAGETLVFAYRVYVHAGDVVGGQVADAFHGYINPPSVSVVA